MKPGLGLGLAKDVWFVQHASQTEPLEPCGFGCSTNIRRLTNLCGVNGEQPVSHTKRLFPVTLGFPMESRWGFPGESLPPRGASEGNLRAKVSHGPRKK